MGMSTPRLCDGVRGLNSSQGFLTFVGARRAAIPDPGERLAFFMNERATRMHATGQCNICGWTGEFRLPERGREGLICGNCSSSSRMRALVYWLGKIVSPGDPFMYRWPGDKSRTILESSARGPHAVMLAEKFAYCAPEFDPAKIAAGAPPQQFADFQKLGFDDSSFDIVIASDVFEHVRDDAAGYREIFRVLKQGGTFLLTVPYSHEQETTIRRVNTDGEQDVMILEPEYHGGGGQTLAYRNYGRDLLALLHSTGFSVVHEHTEIPAFGIVRQSVILGAKGDFVDLHDTPPATGTFRPLGVLVPYRVFLLLKYNFAGFVSLLKQALRS